MVGDISVSRAVRLKIIFARIEKIESKTPGK